MNNDLKRLEEIEAAYKGTTGTVSIGQPTLRWLIARLRAAMTLPEDAEKVVEKANKAVQELFHNLNDAPGWCYRLGTEIEPALALIPPALTRVKELEAENAKLLQQPAPDREALVLRALKGAADLYDQMALSPLEAAAKYGDTYEPPSDEDCLSVRQSLHEAIAALSQAKGVRDGRH